MFGDIFVSVQSDKEIDEFDFAIFEQPHHLKFSNQESTKG